MKTTALKKQNIKLNKKTILILAAIFGLVGAAILLISRAATPGTPAFGLYVSPSTSSIAAGTQISVSAYANLGTNNGINSIASYLRYDPTMLRLDAANQSGVNPNFTVTSRCTNIDGCKPAGEIVFVTGYSGTGVIAPSDGILIGNMTFTALKTGTATLTFDPDSNLSGFASSTIPQSTLSTRTLLNGNYTLLDSTAPSVPTGLTSPSKTEKSVNLSWTASTDNSGGSGMAGYKIYRNGNQVGTSTATTYTDNNLTPSTAYTYTVAAYDVAGNTSSPSSSLAVTTNADTAAPTVPGKPTAGATTMNSIAVSWTASTDNIAVTGYKIFRNGTQVGTSATTSYTDGSLQPGTSYTYTVSAYDATNNNSAQSTSTAISTAADTQAPTTPGNLTVTTPSTTSAAISWTASTDNVGVTGYQVFRNSTRITTTASNVTSHTDSALSPGTYNYTIVAVDAAGNASAATAAKTASIYSQYDPSKDGVVGVADLTTVLSNYGRTGTALDADVNKDNIVNILDISALLTRWGTAG